MALRARDFFEDRQARELAEAICERSKQKLRRLVDAGADLAASGRDGVYPLLWALLNDELESFRILLKAGASPNQKTEDEHSVVSLAAQHENDAYLEAALANGGNVDIRDGNDYSPLILATMKMKPKSIRLLLDMKADVELRDKAGWSALMYAASKNRLEHVKMLLDAGADPDLPAKSGMTARDIARNTAGERVKRLFGISE